MTTHRSKGLEFRAVAVVGLTQGAFPDYRALSDQQAIEAEPPSLLCVGHPCLACATPNLASKAADSFR